MSSEVIRIRPASMAIFTGIQAEYQRRFGVNIKLVDVVDVVTAHGRDAARKKLNLTSPNANTTKSRAKAR